MDEQSQRLYFAPVVVVSHADAADPAAHGFVTDYQGVRISRTGRRCLVKGATVWNVLDEHGAKRGQAATFSRWTWLAPVTPGSPLSRG